MVLSLLIGAMTDDGYGSINFDGQGLGDDRPAVHKSILPLASDLQALSIRISVFDERLESFFSVEIAYLMLAASPSILLLGSLIVDVDESPKHRKPLGLALPKPLFRGKAARCNRPVVAIDHGKRKKTADIRCDHLAGKLKQHLLRCFADLSQFQDLPRAFRYSLCTLQTTSTGNLWKTSF
ncbi:unnamed protein product [Clavelina lepadiformis]|uniref:Uncharacterized protein n=1 Tax=Clavelina lepadiformis TaxID=159417 RepID=A0ABP0FR42_CLALP